MSSIYRKAGLLRKITLAITFTAAVFGLVAYILTKQTVHFLMLIIWLVITVAIYKLEV